MHKHHLSVIRLVRIGNLEFLSETLEELKYPSDCCQDFVVK